MRASHEEAAARLGVQRRGVFLVSATLSLAAAVLPYLSGTWETVWFALAAQPLPFWLRSALFLLGFQLVISLMLAPLAWYGGFVLPHAFGLSRQTTRGWLVDWLKAVLLTAAFGVLVGALFVWAVVTFAAAWWWVFGALITVLGIVMVFVAPYVLVPIFFKMRPLADVSTVERIRQLVDRAGTTVRDVCSLDFSRRTAEANAAVIGLGRSRRVVLADTLLAEFTPNEVDAVVAHELGHHVHRDVQQLLLGNAAVMWLGLGLAAWLTPAALPLLSVPELAYLPAYPVLVALAELYFLLTAPALNWWSRRLESRADRFALRLTRDPAAFASAMRRLGAQNLAEMRPPRWAEVLLATHPALYRRIQLAQSWSA